MTRITFLVAAFALAVGTLPGGAQDKKDKDKPFTDADFVAQAGSSGLHEVELGKMAADRAKDDEVKKLGKMMVDDHTKANEALKEAAKEAGLTVPEKMNAEHQKHVDHFKDLKGADFDKEYVKHMVNSHTAGVALFQRASKEAKSPKLKEFATKTLPVVESHLEKAKKLQERIK
jgi:putative membrane protein